MRRNKISKTFTLEQDTVEIIENFMKEKNLSSLSSSLERIIIEWNTLHSLNVSTKEIYIDNIKSTDIEKNIENIDEKDNLVKDIFNSMPE